MFNRPPREREWLSWLYASLWTVVIYITIPFARRLQVVLDAWGLRPYFLWGSLLVVGGVCVAAGVWVFSRLGRGAWKRLPVLVLILLAFAWRAYRVSTPEEAVHLAEYAILSLLLYRALVHRYRDPLIYLNIIIIGLLLGIGDEFIQWVVPFRFWDYQDVWLNGTAVILATLALAFVIRPELIRRPIRKRSLRLLLNLLLLLFAAFLVTTANTPARVRRYASAIPGLSFLLDSTSMMTEYGYRHENPEMKVAFHSRFTLEELAELDCTDALRAANILLRYHRHDPLVYGKFRITYTALKDPYVHEARVHMYRRDHHRGLVATKPGDDRVAGESGFIAYGEHQILSAFFSNAVFRAGCNLDERTVDELKRHADKHAYYVSPVSKDLITSVSETQLRTMIVSGLVAIFIVRVKLVNRKDDSSDYTT